MVERMTPEALLSTHNSCPAVTQFEKLDTAGNPSFRWFWASDQGNQQCAARQAPRTKAKHTRMSRAEQLVAGLAAAVVVTGLAAGGSAKSMNTTPHGWPLMTDAVNFKPR
ncbi:hypothetical protein SAMN05444161_8410 [Rhizobiales bacterium GAS191]|nr:hypothetical protein SAMN05444161_8410 [Rhizobiales bacterium GAS191]